jgi:hypothetical protein
VGWIDPGRKSASIDFNNRRRKNGDLRRGNRRFAGRRDAEPAVFDAEARRVVMLDLLPCTRQGRHENERRGNCQQAKAHSTSDKER